LTFENLDLLNLASVKKVTRNCHSVYHLAANPEVRLSGTNPRIYYGQNVLATFNLLEAVRKTKKIKVLFFTSSSTVHGEDSRIPTREDYASPEANSVYGSPRLSCEALIAGYAKTYSFKAIICRLANIIGPRSTRGLVYDFVRKLRKNSKKLEVLGDGTQTKSFPFIDDCIGAIKVALKKAQERVDIFNIGSRDQTDIKTIANVVVEEMVFRRVKLHFTGGVDGGKGGSVTSRICFLRRLNWSREDGCQDMIAKSRSG